MPAARTTRAAPGGNRRSSAPAARRPPAQKRRSKPGKATPLRIRWERVGRVVLLIVLAVVLGLYVQQGLAYLSVRKQADQQASIVKSLAHQNARLTRQQSALNNPATIVQEARALGMIKPGERPYVVVGMGGG